jgi:hypothetical protein
MWTIVVGVDPGVVGGEEAIELRVNPLKVHLVVQRSGDPRLVRDDDEAVARSPQPT